MAGSRIKGITIEIDGNTSKLEKALESTNKDLKTTQANLRDVNKLLQLDPGNVDLLKQKQKLLNDAVNGVNDRLAKEKEALKQLKAADQSPEVTQQMEALQRQIADDEAYLKRLEQQAKDFGSVAKQQFQQAGKKVSEFGDKLSGAGQKLTPLSAGAAAIGGGMVKLGLNAISAGDELKTMSEQTGLSTDQLQKYQYAAELVDVSLEDVTGALKKMKPKMTDNNATFQKLGVEVRNADGTLRDVNDVFLDAAAALGSITNETERDQVAMELFGKSADSLAGIIDDGGAALQQYGEQAEELGMILDEDTINALADTDDTIQQLKSNVMATFAQVGANVAEVLGPALEKLGEFLTSITERLRELTPEQTEMILKIVGIVAAVAPLLIIIGKVVSGVGSIISLVGAAIPVITTLATTIAGPIVLAVGAAIAIGVLLYKNWDKIKETAGKVKEWVVEKWNGIKEGVGKAVDAMKQQSQERLDAMKQAYEKAGGGIKGVMSAAFAGLKTTFKQGYDALNTLTGGKLDEIKKKFTDKFNAVKNFVKGVIDKIKGFFNFEFTLPTIKSPHFAISPPGWKIGDLLKGVIPTLDIQWYRKAYDSPMMFTTPTVMATPNGFKGFGDGTGGEIVYGRESLLKDISAATITQSQIYDAMVAALATSNQTIVIGSREFARILRDQGVATV